MKKGFILTLGNRQIFLITDKKYLTENILFIFIDKIGEIKGVSKELIERCKKDKYTLKDLKYRISRATIQECTGGNVSYYKIIGENFTECIPFNEKESLIFF